MSASPREHARAAARAGLDRLVARVPGLRVVVWRVALVRRFVRCVWTLFEASDAIGMGGMEDELNEFGEICQTITSAILHGDKRGQHTPLAAERGVVALEALVSRVRASSRRLRFRVVGEPPQPAVFTDLTPEEVAVLRNDEPPEPPSAA